MKTIRRLLITALLVLLGGVAWVAVSGPSDATTNVEQLARRVAVKAQSELADLLGGGGEVPGSAVPAAPTTPGAGEADAPDTTEYIASVRVASDNGAPRYVVRPTRAGRVAVGDQLDTAWRQAVAMGVPDTPGMEQQFRCHPLSVVARAKPSWSLETWRPAVGLKLTMVAFCNPR